MSSQKLPEPVQQEQLRLELSDEDLAQAALLWAKDLHKFHWWLTTFPPWQMKRLLGYPPEPET